MPNDNGMLLEGDVGQQGTSSCEFYRTNRAHEVYGSCIVIPTSDGGWFRISNATLKKVIAMDPIS